MEGWRHPEQRKIVNVKLPNDICKDFTHGILSEEEVDPKDDIILCKSLQTFYNMAQL